MHAFPGWDLVENQERNEGREYSFFQVWKKTEVKGHRQSWIKPKPEKTACVIRYGAFGDMMMASSVIKGLKDQGYHVTLYATPPGSDVVFYDPNIDRLILQGKDQVPNAELGEYWKYIASKYDKFVNLCESVEGTFLALPGRTNHTWPKNLRHKMMNGNYLEFQHELAEVPHNPQVQFFATPEEKAWAIKQRSKMGEFTILWSLAGSSVHKVWPHLDTILARLMLVKHLDIHVILVGGPECQILEQGWENEPRVHCQSGKWAMRQTLSMIDQCDLIIGPETGVMNAACCRPVPKIVTLSHSSNENLTRDWVNTRALEPVNTGCFPCHVLHYGWDHCHKGMVDGVESGASLCQVNIGAEMMWEAMIDIMQNWSQKAA
jgi:ADP-heptose:LPS heptosyltransferase